MKMDTKKRIKFKQSSWAILAEVIGAVVLCYFFLGGSQWSPKMWAVFAIIAAWIIIMNVRYEAGLESEKSYLKWKQRVGLLMVIALLVSPLWLDSWLPFIIGIILGIAWLDDYRHVKAILRDYSESTKSNCPSDDS